MKIIYFPAFLVGFVPVCSETEADRERNGEGNHVFHALYHQFLQPGLLGFVAFKVQLIVYLNQHPRT